jgi:cAMP-dependent protein kinase regulator
LETFLHTPRRNAHVACVLTHARRGCAVCTPCALQVSKPSGLRRIDSRKEWEATPSFEAPLQLSEAVEIRMLVLEMTRANKQQSEAAAAAAAAAAGGAADAEASGEDAFWTEVPNAPLPVIEKSSEQRAALAAATSRVLLFRQLAPAQYAAVLDAMFERVVRAGETVIRQGDEPDNFYVVDTGAFEVFVSKPPTAPPKLVMTYSQGGTFGELALLNRARRAATVVAKTDGVLWALGRAAFTRVLVDATQRQRDQYSAFLQAVPMLHGLDPYDLAAMADNLVAVSFTPGETVIRQGDAGDAFFLVLDGTGAATVRDDDAPEGVKEVMQYAPGSHFGELALLRDEPRAASVVAKTAMKCARMDVDAFKRILARPLKASMDRQLALYSRATDEKFVR